MALDTSTLVCGDQILFRRSENGPLWRGTFIRLDGACFRVEYDRPCYGRVSEFFLSSGIISKV